MTDQLSISRDVTIEAATTGAVVLDGQDSTRVLYISSGTVELIGLNIARGYVSGSVSLPYYSAPPVRRTGKLKTMLAYNISRTCISPPAHPSMDKC